MYCDAIHGECELNSVQFETHHDHSHKTPARATNLRYLDVIEYGGGFLWKAGLSEAEIPDTTERRLEQLEGEIESRFGTSLDLVSRVRRELADRNAKIGWYRRLLPRIDPHLLVLVVSYGKETLIEAAQSLDITVAELQHGIVHRSHFGYSFPRDQTKETFPDHLLTFSPFWTDDIETPIPDDRVHTFGYPYLQRKLEANSDVQSTDDLLFISQRSVGETLSELAVDAAESPAIDRDIVYKLHPSEYDEWLERYPRLSDSDIEVVDGDDPDLYQLFTRCETQVRYDSTALFKGVNFVDETYIYSDQLKHSMQALVESSGATQIDSLSHLARELDAPRSEAVSAGETYFNDVSPRERCEIIRFLRDE